MNFLSNQLMPLHPAAQQMIRKVKELSGRPVHVAEDPDLKVMASILTARGNAPAHFCAIVREAGRSECGSNPVESFEGLTNDRASRRSQCRPDPAGTGEKPAAGVNKPPFNRFSGDHTITPWPFSHTQHIL